MESLGIQPSELDDVKFDTIKEELMKRERKQNIPQIILDLRYNNA
jgi:anti-anti-sigma regulatory factor